MITFILLFFFFALAVILGAVAYTANNRKRAGQAEIPPRNVRRTHTATRATGND
jgi:preprotein translocase subunit SecG